MQPVKKQRFFNNDPAVIGLSMILYMLLLNGLTLLFSELVPLFLDAASPAYQSNLQIAQRGAGIAAYAITFLFTIIFMSRSSPGFASLSYPKPPGAALTLPAFFAAFLLINYLNAFLKGIFNDLGVYGIDPSLDAPRSGIPLILFVLMYILLPAVLEELLFRGVILFRLRRFGDGFAVVLSSFIFALMHHNMISMPGIFLIGVLFAYATIYSNSIIPAMVMHFLNNAIAILLIWLEQHGAPEASNLLAISIFLVGVTSFAAMFIYAVIFAAQGKKPRRIDSSENISHSGTGKLKPHMAFASVFGSGWMIAFIITAVFITLSLEFFPRVIEQLLAFMEVFAK